MTTTLQRCKVCGGTVAPIEHHKGRCDDDCRHQPDLHPACRQWPHTGAVYGPDDT